jgi:Ca-activated chloride channel family protein
MRRHLPFVLFLFALASLAFSLTRPSAEVDVPSRRATIILALDVSRSMCSTDILPSRLAAAKVAALSFIKSQDSATQIGIVAFAGFAEIIQTPTNDQKLLQDAITRLTTARRTAIGSGILKSLDAIAEIDANVPPVLIDGLPAPIPQPVAEGEYVPAIIVLLTDGVTTTGPIPMDAAQEAMIRGVRVYTIGFGTSNPEPMTGCSQFQTGDRFGATDAGGGGGGGGGFRRGIDEETLQQIANLTGGEYYAATSAGELQAVFKNLPAYLITTKELIEISVIFTAIGALFALVAILLAMIWNPLN